jgi:hypothetical protein
LRAAVVELWPFALGVLELQWRPRYAERVADYVGFELPDGKPVARGEHIAEWPELWDEMTMVRRSAPAGAAW